MYKVKALLTTTSSCNFKNIVSIYFHNAGHVFKTPVLKNRPWDEKKLMKFSNESI